MLRALYAALHALRNHPRRRLPARMNLHRDRWPLIARIGWPVALTLVIRVTMRTADLLVVGRYVGAVGVAALGIGDTVARIVLMTAIGLGAGTIATVSQSLGAGRRDDANIATTQTAVLALAIGVPLGILGWFAAPGFYRLLGANDQVTTLGVDYFRLIILTAGPRMLSIMLTRALQGSGDTRSPMVIRSVSTTINIVLTVLLVPGMFGLPKLGVVGAAVGTATGNVLAALLLVVVLAWGRRPIGFCREGLWRPDWARRIVRIGLPQVAERNLYALALLPLNGIVLSFGTAANAGFQVGFRLQLYALLPSRGVSTAVSHLVGTQVGRGDLDGAARDAHAGLWLSSLVSVVAVVPLLIFARPVAGLFVHEPDALAAATDWVRVYGAVTVLRALYGVMRGALQGAGDTRPSLVATFVGVAVFAVGFSWVAGLGMGMGIVGVFAGVLLDPVARLALLRRWFDPARWAEAAGTAAAAPASEVTASGR